MKRALPAILLAACVSISPLDDDDAANDDDSALDEDDCGPMDPLNIEAEADVELGAVAPTAVGETLQGVLEVLSGAGPECPLRDGDIPDGTAGTVTFSGPCEAGGLVVDGSLRVNLDPTVAIPTNTLIGDGFVAYGPLFREEAFGTLALDGSAELESDGIRDGFLRVTVEGRLRLTPDQDDHPLTVVFPHGFDGELQVVRRSEDGTRTFEGAAEGSALCRSAFGWAVDLTASPDCEPEPSFGTITVRFDGRESLLTAGDGRCDGCLAWSVDGVPREEPLCFDGG